MNELHVFLLRVGPGPRGVLGAVQWPIYILCTLDESTALQIGYTLDESKALQIGLLWMKVQPFKQGILWMKASW